MRGSLPSVLGDRLRPLRRLAAAPLLLALLLAAGPAPAGAAELGCSDVADLVDIYLQKHIRYRGLEEEVRERAVDSYLERLDPQRVLFMEEEAEKLEASLEEFFDEFREGECERLTAIQKEVVERHEAVEAFMRDYVGGEGYELDRSAELVLDPEERGRPADPEARAALLRTLAHFQVSNYVTAGTELPRARERLVHRYELQSMRAKEQTEADLYALFLDAFANALDPHTNYLSADVLEDFQIQMQLSLEGIGVALSSRNGYAVVEQIIPGGAAEQEGSLQPNDKIVAVAEEDEPPVDVIDKALRDVVRLIRGEKGSDVELTVLRQTGEDTERFQVTITRAKIDLEQQAAKLRIETRERDGKTLKLAVLSLPSFYGDRDPDARKGSRDVRRLLRKARKEEVDGLVLDLSRNGGGLLEDAVKISGFFIREGGVVAIRDASGEGRVLRDPSDELVYGGPMVVLTSRVSASASEILAGALKDYRRAVVIGDDHTFGKGTVQSVFPLRPGLGALKVTTALFFRPGGISTQNRGVETDLVVPSLFNTDEYGEKTQSHAIPARRIEPFRDADANGEEGEGRYTPVTDDMIQELAERSQQRIAESEFFQRVREELAERASDDGAVTLAEMLEEREQGEEGGESGGGTGAEGGVASAGGETAGMAVADDGGSSEGEGEGDDEPSPHVKEALHVLADLVMLQQ